MTVGSLFTNYYEKDRFSNNKVLSIENFNTALNQHLKLGYEDL